MIMQLLKSATKPHHDKVEELAYSNKIMEGTINIEEYKELLLKQHYFHKNIEPFFEKVFSEKEAIRLEVERRKKTHLLKYDLLELGLEEEALNFEQLPHLKIETAEEAIGAMYVLEGSTLGGAVIRRKLGKNEKIKGNSSFNYYGCYGEETGEFWKKFIMQATIMANTEEKQEVIVNKAIEAFVYFENILKLGIVTFKPQHQSL